MQNNKENPFNNDKGYADPTAYYAMKPIIKEEKELEKKVRTLMSVLRLIADWAGFEFIGRIQLRHKKSRREFK